MSICTFFGHRNMENEIEPILRSTLIDLIENKNVNLFYVGNQGEFDFLVKKNLKLLKLDFPHIDYAVVLPYMPKNKCNYNNGDLSDSIYPEGFENIPPKYAIIERNKWMINKSDYVVTYVTHSYGGAFKFKEFAEKKHRILINLADLIK